MIELPLPVRPILDRGVFCHVAALTPLGPHVTPMVFATARGAVWVTTSRGSVKARAWRSVPRVAGLVRSGREAVAFAGRAAAHDVLDPSSWGRSLARAPRISLAATRFIRRNARFFAGYAVDAGRVPLAWTPPGRVFVELAVERVALLRDGEPPRTWGEWDGALPTAERFRAARTGAGPLEALPREVAEALGEEGDGALALEGEDGPVVLPVRWRIDGAALYAVLGEQTLELAAPSSSAPRAALAMDRASAWRARAMIGAMARGAAEINVPTRLVSGARSARAVAAAAGGEQGDDAIVRLRAERFVWWRGWSSGTVPAR